MMGLIGGLLLGKLLFEKNEKVTPSQRRKIKKYLRDHPFLGKSISPQGSISPRGFTGIQNKEYEV